MDKLKRILFSTLMVLATGWINLIQAAQSKDLPQLLPMPWQMKAMQGEFVAQSTLVIAVPSKADIKWGDLLVSYLKGYQVKMTYVKVGRKGAILFQYDKTLKEEAYRLSVAPDQILIQAADEKGFFYAIQSLRQLLPEQGNPLSIPTVEIEDAPRFAYRGLMLDVARYFLPKEDLLRLIDRMAELKLNKLHLHLSDDNGWRLEIKRYPLLTQIGAWRVQRDMPFFERRNPLSYEPTPTGGFYTQEEMREVIAFAADRGVEIIPEIDVPAHSNAALAAYPELACPVVKDFIGVLPGLGGDNAKIIFCAGNDKVFDFLDGVMDEVMELFPSKYIHIGGDEANKYYWERCPHCQERIRTEHLKDAEALQGYFMERVARYIRGRGREVMGWDELTNAELPQNSIIFGWQGMGNAALKAAAQGHRFVMTPARKLYLIRYQGPQWFEPLTYFGNNTLKDVFDYEPVQKDWKPAYESLLEGIQGSMWTEFCNRPEDVFYQIFPRLAAVAHRAWCSKGNMDWQGFLAGLDNWTHRWDKEGMTYARSMFNIQHTVRPEDGVLNVVLECIRPDMEIRYTTDGSYPTAGSQLYTAPIRVSKTQTVQAATFYKGKMMGKVLSLPIQWNLATAKPILNARSDEALMVNGVRGSTRQTDFEWCTWPEYKDVSFTIDLQQVQPINEIKLGNLTVYGMAVHKPKNVCIEILDDRMLLVGKAEKHYSDAEIFSNSIYLEELVLPFEAIQGRYVKVSLEGPGNCPSNHVRPGQTSRFYIDEVIVN